jgi:hypothetical protein
MEIVRTRSNTNLNGTEANAAGRSERACAARESKREDFLGGKVFQKR